VIRRGALGALIALAIVSNVQAASLEARVHAALAARGWSPNALLVPHNLVRHEPVWAPRGAPPQVNELLARPLAAAEARTLFERHVPETFALPPSAAGDFETLLARYLVELENREAFLEATARFVNGLRLPGLRFPAPQRRETRIGTVVIGSAGADRHGSDAALIIDPAGDDVYERAPPARGAISVVVDLGGNDRYSGSDLVHEAYSALIDVAGNDRYDMEAGLGAARRGVSLLLDLEGDDEYRVRARGQGYAAEGGLGVLWDRAGDDLYVAGGLPDPWGREGGLSYAQGAAVGARGFDAGGVGILRDDEGNDRYEAQMFAQGMGYYFGIGLLWDRGGNDRYLAVRYAQGAGVHQAIGVLRDEGGDDAYALRAGVGQGVGHDMALGVLVDLLGEDRYEAQYLAQGNASANGLGVLADLAGRTVFSVAAGQVDPSPMRGLPSIGLVVHDAPRTALLRSAALSSEARPAERCPPLPPMPPDGRALDARLPALLAALAPDLERGKPDAAAYGEALRRLIDDPEGAISQAAASSFDAMWALSELLPCAMAAATEEEAELMRAAFARILATDPATRYAGIIAAALRRRPATGALQQRLVAALDAHPSCAVRSLALEAWARPERARAALSSACWREQSAGLQALQRLNADSDPAALPSFLRP
jgi:hypothetical protein